ncbi:MAG: hypothetical protein ACREQ4_07650, partial [Candidatus Binataceae bacterium]
VLTNGVTGAVKVLMLLYRSILRMIGALLALFGFALLFVPMLGIVLLWAGAIAVAASNWDLNREDTITAPAETVEDTGIIVRIPVAMRARGGAFRMAMTRVIGKSETSLENSTEAVGAAKQAT